MTGRKEHFASTLTSQSGINMTDEKTDYSRWRLRDDRGRQTWHYLKTDKEIEEWPQSTADKHFLGLDMVRFSFHLCGFDSDTFR